MASPVRIFLPLVPALALSACAVATPVSVASTGAGFGPVASIYLPEADSSQAQRATFEAALRRKFSDRSVRMDKAAPLLADYAISYRDAATGLADPEGNTAGKESIDWDSTPRKGRLFDKCDAIRMRATLVVMSRASGTVVYRGEGEADACRVSDSDLDRLADKLVDDALAQAGN